jgi:hypothetical protein
MSGLYLRKYRLLIGEAVTKITEYKTVKKVSTQKTKIGFSVGDDPVQYRTFETQVVEDVQVEAGQRVEGGKAIEITSLKIEATINKALTETGRGGDTTQIKVYNLSPDSKKYLQGPNVVVQLFAGYETDAELSLLYSGYVIKQTTSKNGQDKVTTLTCVDAAVPKVAARAEVSFTPGTKTEDAIRSVASSISGLSVGTVLIDENTPPMLIRGFSYSGNTWEGLNKLCTTNGCKAYVDNGVVNVAPKKLDNTKAAISSYKAKAIVITPRLIKGSIEPMTDTTTSSPTEGDKTAIRINTFLDARLVVDGYLVVQGTENHDGNYRITSVSHSLDSRGGSWDTTVESEKII